MGCLNKCMKHIIKKISIHFFNKMLIKKLIDVLTQTADKQTSNVFHKTCFDEKFLPSFAWAELWGVNGFRCKLATKLSM